MIRFLQCVIIVLTFPSLLDAQILFEEDFESGSLPNGWTIQSNATDGGWKVGSTVVLSSEFFEIASNGSNFVIGTNDDFCNCNKRDEYLLTPAVDLSGVTTAALSFESYYGDQFFQGGQEDATIEASSDGTNWTLLEDLHGHFSWDIHKIDITAFAGEPAVQFRFKYSDQGGWLYGMAIDNVIVEVPKELDVTLIELNSRDFGEVNTDVPIRGSLYNGGSAMITEMQVSYSIDGGTPVVEDLTGLQIPAFTYSNFELPTPWKPSAPGNYEVTVKLESVNGMMDSNTDDNTDDFVMEVFEKVEVPNLD